MTKQISYHRCALWALVVCLAAAAGCRRTPTDQLDLTTLLPGDPSWLVAADLPALRGWELWPELERNGLDSDGTLGRFFAEAGIEPDRDLDRLVVGICPSGEATGGFNAILTGRFDGKALSANLESHGHRADSWRDVTLISPDETHHPSTGAADHLGVHVVCFDETAIGLAEACDGARAMIDRLLDGGESLDRHPGFGPLLAEVDRTAPLWGTGLMSEDALSGLAADLPVQGMIPALENLAFSVRLDTGLQLTCLTLLPTDERATRLAGQLNGWVKLAAGLIQANPQWFDKEAGEGDQTLRLVADTLDRMAISASGPAVWLKAQVPAELIREAARSEAAKDPQPLHFP